jgi:hypothetical protein
METWARPPNGLTSPPWHRHVGPYQDHGAWRHDASAFTRLRHDAEDMAEPQRGQARSNLQQGGDARDVSRRPESHSALSTMRVPTVFWTKASGRC